MKTAFWIPLIAAFLLPLVGCGKEEGGEPGQKCSYTKSFVQLIPHNSAYFQLSNGDTYLPVGCNICWAKNIETLEGHFEKLSENGGIYARLWISHGLFEYQPKYGEVNRWGIGNLDRAVYASAKYGIKLKLCVEDCRLIEPQRGNKSNVKVAYHVDNGGLFNNVTQYITTPVGKQVYLERVVFFKERYGDNPGVFAWELWNEMNAVQTKGDAITAWNREMIPLVQRMFPKNLVTQSLGCMDREWCFPCYEAFMAIPENRIMQVHRYLDEGAPLAMCQQPMDILCSDAVKTLRDYDHCKPVLLAETGAVMSNHTCPHAAYENDVEEMILHDVLFAPFFNGAAGTGECWHWDQYIDRNNLWWHFRRFANAVKRVDPVVEGFVPAHCDQNGMRVCVLQGTHTTQVWCRDEANTWQPELVELIPPSTMRAKQLDLSAVLSGKGMTAVECYNPRHDLWGELPASS